MVKHYQLLILGAGMSGLAAAMASQAPILEKGEAAGGICLSYYMRPGTEERLAQTPADGEAYRFENGGGHWIFGGEPAVLKSLQALSPLRRYSRNSSVFLNSCNLYVPYPIQNHLGYLGPEVAARALQEIIAAPHSIPATMAEWIAQNFGSTLTGLFFAPFQELYTAGLWTRIAPQDAYKTPIDLSLVLKGAFGSVPPVGYNATFAYPESGLDSLIARMAAQCQIHHGKEAIRIDTRSKTIQLADGTSARYEHLISTLPLNRMIELTGICIDRRTDPHTSVLVLNIGAAKGRQCPADHWLYTPQNRSGFHRVGFYSNVDPSFLPVSSRTRADRMAIYVERSYPGNSMPSWDEIRTYRDCVVQELQEWQYIEEVEVADPTWVEVGYTWAWPGSRWKQEAMSALEAVDIFQVGRYGRWTFQGIADSVRDGFIVGAALKATSRRQ
ncbi:protoporphyrinogen/coproporphyrinogen oxidase [Desulfoferrobacter suflitae]|uniref:protoporphyrinogen/coproporphyrinogen oxidase n=1 Tax=Desulfoferrobacter suflitae TaxID=2865782 RepID=UPI0021647DB5|nr:hypothetical protein [Desulfoferrobacter suflitae]MCK8600211.1 hypothetical protein [Desulfoferrobacter suflitae]